MDSSVRDRLIWLNR